VNGDKKRGVLKIRSIKINKNLLSFGFFLLLSALFWFFNALNKEYYIDLMVPIKYINLPDNKLQLSNERNFIKVNVSAYGYEVIDYKTSSITPVLIDFKNFSSQSLLGKKGKKYYILTQSLRDGIINVLGPKLKINKIIPDSLFIDLVKVMSKKVPIRHHFKIGCRKQYMIRDSVKFFPDSVTIKGLEPIIDTIHEVYTEKKVIEDFHDSLNFDVELEKIKGTEFISSMVNCQINAEQYTEMEYKLPVFILNEPIAYSVKLFPSEVRVVFNIGFDDYRKITSEQFRIIVDYLDLEQLKSTRALLKLNRKPDNVSSIRICPQSVDYIIEKND
jgi:hypothetical protein